MQFLSENSCVFCDCCLSCVWPLQRYVSKNADEEIWYRCFCMNFLNDDSLLSPRLTAIRFHRWYFRITVMWGIFITIRQMISLTGFLWQLCVVKDYVIEWKLSYKAQRSDFFLFPRVDILHLLNSYLWQPERSYWTMPHTHSYNFPSEKLIPQYAGR